VNTRLYPATRTTLDVAAQALYNLPPQRAKHKNKDSVLILCSSYELTSSKNVLEYFTSNTHDLAQNKNGFDDLKFERLGWFDF